MSKYRWKKKFAFTPKRMGSGYLQHHQGNLVWLEFYWELEYFMYGKWTPYCAGVTWTQKPWPFAENAQTVSKISGAHSLQHQNMQSAAQQDMTQQSPLSRALEGLIKINALGILVLLILWFCIGGR